MNQSPSRYGGIAAVLVFGIGLLAVGRTWAGVGVLVFGALAMAVALAPSASGRAFFVALGALILAGVLGYQAASNEITGRATYQHGIGRGSWSEPVTREVAPAKFREATDLLWTGSILGLIAGVVVFSLARKLDRDATDF